MPDPILSSDAMSIEFDRTTLQEAVKGDRRTQLEAIRDYIAHELEGNLCNTCANSRLRTGDQASLILRLQTVLGEIDSLPKGEEVNRLANIRSIGIVGGTASEPVTDFPTPDLQQRTGSRRPGAGRRSQA